MKLITHLVKTDVQTIVNVLEIEHAHGMDGVKVLVDAMIIQMMICGRNLSRNLTSQTNQSHKRV